ncbi:MAG: hypothetical protein DI529_17845 [Chryseobacterium sp.]|nr:MAG: hypothetical protein DI529_17845 [Chryseobacterium sp.]
MRKKLQLLLILIFGINAYTEAQYAGNQNQYDPKINSVPTSPEVALLGRFGEIPVGHYTGTAEVSIPLYNVKVDNIEIPLALSYHTSGIKVADEATWVGLGWNFLPEGTITQEIRGREDSAYGDDGFQNTDGYNTFKNNFITLFSENQLYRLQNGFSEYRFGGGASTGGDPSITDSSQIIDRLTRKYGQPDIYSYNFCGYSGKFFFNPENYGEILFLESNENVQFAKNIDGWVATTNKGDKFYFYAIEIARSNQTDYPDIGYTFKLTKILLSNGKTIILSYQDESTIKEYPIETAHITNYTMNQSVRSDTNTTINHKKTLIAVETEDTKVDFNLEDREDIRPYNESVPIKKLKSIDIKQKYSNKKLKSFVFNYNYFPYNSYNTVIEGYDSKRLKLESVQQLDYDNNGNPIENTHPYTFEYDTNYVMPSKTSNSDFFGYYNGNGAGTKLPDLTYFDYLNKSPYKNYGYNPIYPYFGSMRFADSNYVSTNILKKVNYPTKGYSTFEFEPNTFSNQFIPTKQQVEGATKGNGYAHRGPGTGSGYVIVGERFKLNHTTKVKFNNYIFDGYSGYNPTTHTDFATVQSSCKIQLFKSKIINGQYSGEMIKEWNVVSILRNVYEQTHQMSWNETLDIPYDDNPTTEYHVAVVNGVQSGSGQPIVSCGYSYIADIDTSISYGNGLRIKTIKNYDSNNDLIGQKNYEYIGGKLIYKFEPLNLIQGASYKSQPHVQTGGCYVEQFAIFNDLSVNSSDFGIGGSKSFGYDAVVEKDIDVNDDNVSKGFTKYYFTNKEPTGTSYKWIPRVGIPENGENTLIEQYNDSLEKIRSISKFYVDLPNYYGIYPSFHILHTSTGIYDPLQQFFPYAVNGCPVTGQVYTGATLSNPLPSTKFNFIFNPLIKKIRRLKSTTDIKRINGVDLADKTENFFNSLGNVWLSTRTTPDGKVFNTEYKYAEELGNTLLIDKGMTGIPLITETTSNGKQLNKNYIIYPERPDYPTTQAGYLVVPLSAKNVNLLTGDLSTEITYDLYDNQGNLLQYTSKSGISTVIVWGYNQTRPIAKIEGATYPSSVDQKSTDVSQSLIDVIVNASNADASQASGNDESALLTALDAFRTNTALSGYQVTTYTYDPLIGVRSITPPSGVRENYIYDTANRLEKVVDINGNILKEYKYNYKQ